MLRFVAQFLDFWIPLQVKQHEIEHLKGRLMVQSFLMVMPLMFFYAVQYLWLEYYWGAAYAIYGLVSAMGAIVDFRNRGNFKFSGNFFAFTSFVIIAAFNLTSNGLDTLIAAWVIMVPISGFLLVSIRSGIFWSVAAVFLVVGLFMMQFLGIQLPNYVPDEYRIFVNATSLLGLIGYIVIILLNNDLGKVRLLTDLGKAKNDVDLKNAEITSINHDLEDIIAKRTARLQAANDELDTFLYESSHALRRPLLRILGLMSLLENEISFAEKERFLGLIGQTAINMDKMLKDLLLVSKVYNQELSLKACNLAETVDAMLEQYDSKIEIVTEIPLGFSMEIDPELLGIVLQKLLDNAIGYRKTNAVHEVKIVASRQDALTQIRIVDNGMGIEPAFIPQLFKMFARGTEKSHGSGLGLFIVGKAIERLNGKVKIESESGLGTVVILEFENVEGIVKPKTKLEVA